MSRALGEQDESHRDKFKFATNAKCAIFMLSDSVANTVFKQQNFYKEPARLLTAAVARTLANIKSIKRLKIKRVAVY